MQKYTLNRRRPIGKIIEMPMTFFQRLLSFLIAAAVVIIISGTVIAGMSGKLSPSADLRRREPSPAQAASQTDLAGLSMFTAIGTLRAGTADNPQIPVVLSVYFPYPAADTVFYEELSQKNRKMRVLIASYFSQYTKAQLLSRGELVIKRDIIELINGELVSGKITRLFFEQYIFLD